MDDSGYETQSYWFQWSVHVPWRNCANACFAKGILLYQNQIFFFLGLKSFAGILIHCLKKLTGVISLTLCFLSVFSLTGMGLFMGNLKHKCLRWPQENETATLHNRPENPYYIRGMNHLPSMSKKLQFFSAAKQLSQPRWTLNFRMNL